MNLLVNKSENNFEQCIKCTICTVYCPVSKVNPEYPGPKQSGPDGERLRLKNPDFYDESLKYCINCKRCEVACPSNVKIGDIIQMARIKYSQKKPTLRDTILAHTDFMGTLATPFAPVVNAITSAKPVKKILDPLLQIDKRRNLPKYSFGTFRNWYKKIAEQQKTFAEQVSYFHGCYVNYNNPQLGKDLIKIMNSLNIGVQLLEKERCCGIALISNGFIDKAAKNAKLDEQEIRKSVLEKKLPVLTTSSSCTFTIRDEHPHLLGIDNREVRDEIELATRYIYRLLSTNQSNIPEFNNGKLKIAYHTPCHMEKLGWSYYSIELLKLIPNVEVTVLDSNCCGIAGTFGFKKENHETSKKIGESLFKQIEEGGFDLVSSDCETCKWQIEMFTSKKCEHPLSILAKVLA
ncbi:anaerobic glycerol-3-phosphate dehydrogenase subunit GlpC [Apibacter sp. HY039]|uniref:anaerobic glycerol-3-phosphate dehydrogenase subunit GlpC n=1 Tax=Apibacter sp. HY039 TaxID=2501476 RepID=UPI000FEBA5B8|nr:anaerobic glycerol-3-phosphate dehydrogenase subunit GlpC [Apibacter sp. HY039]